jgi:hypothetical protein
MEDSPTGSVEQDNTGFAILAGKLTKGKMQGELDRNSSSDQPHQLSIDF